MIINATNLSELYDALANATGGETIELAPGDYGDLVINGKSGFDTVFNSEVTLISADPENPAVFSKLTVEDAANITLDGVIIDYSFQQGDPLWTRAANVTDSSNITIRNSTFDGDLAQGVSNIDDGYGTGVGLSTRGSTKITIENNEFFDFHRGMTTTESSEIIVRGNDIHSIRSDGMNFSQVSDVLIEGNYVHDFSGSLKSSDHRDMLQFHTNNTDTPSTNITIRGNHFDIGEGDYTQSILMRNEEVDGGRAGEELFYQNVLIEDNVIVNGHTIGIRVGETDGLIIRNNSVLHADGAVQDGADQSVEIPRITVASDSINVSITRNITSDISGIPEPHDWVVHNNVLVQDQDPLADGYYADVFITTSLTPEGTAHEFLAVPGSVLDLVNAGAEATHDFNNNPELNARFHMTQSEDNAALYPFDASASTGLTRDLPEGTVFTWTFSDGTVLEGESVSHHFSRGGLYDVALSVIQPDGQTDQNSIVVSILGSNVVSYNTSNGLMTYEHIQDAQNELSAATTEPGIRTEQQGVAFSIAREHVVDIIGQDELTISLTLQGGLSQDSGEIMRLHGSFILAVDSNGEVVLHTFTQDGARTQLITSNANINDGAEHNVEVQLQNGVLEINVDGATLASAEMTSTLSGLDGHDLVFGSPWGGDNFESVISNLDITVNASDFAEADIPYVQPVQPEEPEVLSPAQATEETPPQLMILPQAERERAQQEGIPPLSEVPSAIMPDGVSLGGRGVTFQIDREDADAILGRDAFSISLQLTADGPDSAGEVMRLHQSFVTAVTADGEFFLQAFTQDGNHIQLTTQGADLKDREPHDIRVTLNEGYLDITVDGTSLARTEMTSPLANEGSHDLVLGNPWGRDNFEGVVTGLDLTVIESRTEAVSSFNNILATFVPSNETATSQLDSEAALFSEGNIPGTTNSTLNRAQTGTATSERVDYFKFSSEEWSSHMENQLINGSDTSFG